jgi:hypothetical protein
MGRIGYLAKDALMLWHYCFERKRWPNRDGHFQALLGQLLDFANSMGKHENWRWEMRLASVVRTTRNGKEKRAASFCTPCNRIDLVLHAFFQTPPAPCFSL